MGPTRSHDQELLDVGRFYARETGFLSQLLEDVATTLPLADGVWVLKMVADHRERCREFEAGLLE